ncbi:hypothetical protein [Paraburkholderia sp. J67]|uniref:hypothetical protein n=1 Tax=Paraburkholderia sp. J67 TaxID=2805435 RepID=UPI002ABE07E9|nr:hypothetical protein [Paraburkholderia sp. J67]
MTRTLLSVASWLICTGMPLTGLSSEIPAHAQNLIAQPSDASKEPAMHDDTLDVQQHAIVNVLVEAMAILREDNPFNSKIQAFGELSSTETDPDYPGSVYLYTNRTFPEARITLSTATDPRDDSKDRMRVQVIPATFEILFTGELLEVSRPLLVKHLDLADYWVDRDGKPRPGNDLGPGFPPLERVHQYRYRANDPKGTGLLVDVDLDYADPDSSDTDGRQKLLHVRIERRMLSPHARNTRRQGR